MRDLELATSSEITPVYKSSSYWRFFKGERVLKSVLEWEDPIAMDNVNKLLKGGQLVGQMTFDNNGKFDTLYFLKGQND